MSIPIKARRLVHFTGFEPLDAEAHYRRFDRAIKTSSATFGYDAKVGALHLDDNTPGFKVESSGPNWATTTQFNLLEHSPIIANKLGLPLLRNMVAGYRAAAMVIIYGGLWAYLKTSWRFALFFLFPFLLVAALLSVAMVLAASPFLLNASRWWLCASLPLGILAFYWLFNKCDRKFHINLLFANWQIGNDVATGQNPDLQNLLDSFARSLMSALKQPADEYVLSSHSMGGAMLVHTVGTVLESNPALFQGKRVVICTMGGAGLQCSLLRPAKKLRHHALLMLQSPDLVWLDVQCMTDVVNFYTKNYAGAHGLENVAGPSVIFIRFKNMLTREKYKKIKLDFLRVHRQFVLGSEKRSHFDFFLLGTSPIPAAEFANFTPSKIPPISEDGKRMA